MPPTPPTPRDYRQAAERHFADADLLAAAGRLDNADQLNGFSAECALNAILVALGHMPGAGRPAKPFDGHADRAWTVFLSNATGPVAAPFVAQVPAQNPFDDWRAEQRYVPTGFITSAVHAAHRTGAAAAIAALRAAHRALVVS